MYVFLFFLVVQFFNVVDLSKPTKFQVRDRAADTVKLIDFIHKVNNFEVKLPFKLNNRDHDRIKGKSKGADKDYLDIVDIMELLQKNYDIGRKFNNIPKPSRLQYISNPEVLDVYKNLNNFEEQNEEYDDDLSHQDDMQRPYVKELRQLKYFRADDKNRTDTEIPTTNNDDGNAAEEIDPDKNATKIIENLRTQDSGRASESSPENADKLKEEDETFKLVKPIVQQMLMKYSVKDSRETSVLFKNKAKLKNTAQKKTTKENIKLDNDEDNHSINKEAINLDDHTKNKQNELLYKTKNSKGVNEKHNRHLNKKNNSFSKYSDSDPKVTIEDSTSEEIKSDQSDNNHDEFGQNVNHRGKSKKTDRGDNEHIKKIEPKQKQINSKIKKESHKDNSRISMEEQTVDWSNYDENKNTDEHDSLENDDSSNKKNKKVIHKNKNKKLKKRLDKKHKNENDKVSITNKNNPKKKTENGIYKTKISTKRKGDWNDKMDTDENDENENKDDTIYSKKNKRIKQEDNSYKESMRQKNNFDKKDDSDFNTEDFASNTKKVTWNKKDDDWDEKDDDWDKKEEKWNTKEEKFNKKEDKWHKKDSDYDDHEETKKNDYKNNLKRDSAWDNVGTTKKQNSQWGRYDSFKNTFKNVNRNQKDSGRQAETQSKEDFNPPKHSSWDNYAPKRDDHYDKPNRQGRMNIHGTPIPIVGKRPLYAD